MPRVKPLFRAPKLSPPNGWPAVWWELAIVALGVLIALAAQQWADGRSWAGKAAQTREALRAELATHYSWSAEWRAVTPCMLAQIDGLRRRVLASGATLQPAPVFTNGRFRFVVRLPSKEYARGVYEAALADGVLQRFEPALRQELNSHYAQADYIEAMTRQNGDDYQALFGLSRAIPLDPSVRFEFLRTLDALAGRIEYMDLLSGQLIDHVGRVGMIPPAAEVRRDLARFGTWRFCRDHRLPLRRFREATAAVPN